MNSNIQELKDLIEEYEELLRESERMSDAWDNGDECDQATNDPGLQFEKDMEIDSKYEEILNFCKEISKGV